MLNFQLAPIDVLYFQIYYVKTSNTQNIQNASSSAEGI